MDCFTFFTFGSDGKAFEEEDARDLLGFVFSGSEFSAAFRFAGFPSDFLDDLLLVFGVVLLLALRPFVSHFALVSLLVFVLGLLRSRAFLLLLLVGFLLGRPKRKLITATEYLMALALRGKKLPCIVYC